MGRTRRGFTPEYKDEAVKLVINTGRPVAVVARELGIQESTLGRWVSAFKAPSTLNRCLPEGALIKTRTKAHRNPRNGANTKWAASTKK